MFLLVIAGSSSPPTALAPDDGEGSSSGSGSGNSGSGSGNSGDGSGSGEEDVLILETSSNVNLPGTFAYRLDQQEIILPSGKMDY